jgi:hypothetical protein
VSLHFYLETKPCAACGRGPEKVYWRNITHNLGSMAKAAGIYMHLWHPEGLPEVTCAGDLIASLTAGLEKLRAEPAKYEAFNSPNGWGLYENFVPFVESVLAACVAHPKAIVRTST